MDLDFVYITCTSGWKHLVNLHTIAFVTKYDSYYQVVFTNGIKLDTNTNVQDMIYKYK